ncbi:expressed protein [Phakopsora pachyrhizi]|uniref:Expressed protein n=1 Tax=Phakopsora pachyrhizi TaxID=170000 RepID=A0AAV0BU62_PHAPC|nr:expressed protein [Phakopsora pachyrhizi]
MSTPEEARQVIHRLHGEKIEGYELNVSYAFIQRSGGPGVSLDKSPTPNIYDQRRAVAQAVPRLVNSRKIQEHSLKRVSKNFLVCQLLKVPARIIFRASLRALQIVTWKISQLQFSAELTIKITFKDFQLIPNIVNQCTNRLSQVQIY